MAWGGFLSSIVNAFSQSSTNDKNLQIARENAELQRELNDANIAYQREANEQNIAFQRETNAQNEALMREGWKRDDSAYQRKAADLKAAGLSQTLAAGGSAMSSSPVRLNSPSVNAVNAGQAATTDYQEQAIQWNYDLLNQMQMGQEFATKRKENKLLNERIKEQKFWNDIREENKEAIATGYVNSFNNRNTSPFKSKILSDAWTIGGRAKEFFSHSDNGFRPENNPDRPRFNSDFDYGDWKSQYFNYMSNPVYR